MTLRGVLLGTAVGDALGLPWEGARGEVVARADPADMLLLSGRGVLSDDTEQSVLVASAWAAGPDRFAVTLRRSLRKWFVSLPVGIGFGTARALMLGRGVASAGNGAAMRAAPLGVLVPKDRLLDVVRAASEITHTDPRAIEGAQAVALAAAGASPDEIVAVVTDPELRRFVSLAFEADLDALLDAMGVRGFVTGFVNHTVPVALHLWHTHDDFEAGVRAAVCLGGDTDTVAAITGGLLGAKLGPDAIPQRWLDALGDWPLSLERLEAAARGEPVSLPWLPMVLRNLTLLPVFLGHAIWRRLRYR